MLRIFEDKLNALKYRLMLRRYKVSGLNEVKTDAPEGLSNQIRDWMEGLGEELAFWNYWMASRGAEWPEEFTARYDVQYELPVWACKGIDDPHAARFLDVGSGPVSVLGSMWKGRPVDLVAVDPLAPYYRHLAARHGLPCTVVQGFAEDLTSIFEPDSFDFVHCTNALDHSFDPLRGIEEMILVAKPGGRILITNHIDEAEKADYTGLHQWNFGVQGSEFIIKSRRETINVTHKLAELADIHAHEQDENITITGLKVRATPFDLTKRARARNQQILAAAIAAAISA